MVREPFPITGWTIDLASTSGTGIDLVDVWAYPAAGGPAIFVGEAHTGGARPDVAAFFGPQFTPSGYGLTVRGLPPGGYMLVVFAHSTATGTFPLSKVVNVQITTSATVMLDAPHTGALLSQGFLVGGWAADFGAPSGGGIDLVHVYAYPASGAPPVFLGAASVNVRRPDVAAAFGSQFGSTGFNLFAPQLAPGGYRIVAFGRSLVSGTFSAVAVADVSVR